MGHDEFVGTILGQVFDQCKGDMGECTDTLFTIAFHHLKCVHGGDMVKAAQTLDFVSSAIVAGIMKREGRGTVH